MWRKVRKAPHIPPGDRDTFERYGENVMALLLTGGLNPRAKELIKIYGDEEKHPLVRDWLTERSDLRECREKRMEFVEWAILVFVVLAVFVDVVLLVCQHCWPHWSWGAASPPQRF